PSVVSAAALVSSPNFSGKLSTTSCPSATSDTVTGVSTTLSAWLTAILAIPRMAAADNITTFLIRHVLLLRIQGPTRLGHSVCPPLISKQLSIANSHTAYGRACNR